MRQSLRLFLFSFAIASSAIYLTTHRTQEKKLLVLGCARSGTLYISKVLKACGLHIRHEKMGKEGMSTCDFVVDPEVGRWNLRPKDYHFAHIFHQVRDPLQVIASTYKTEDIHSWH
ncbi:MAG: hypothetical protein HY324_01025, partial [Chlamydiia bacterium]|nr:hypothetical protein [Chlamydiia bacterium]